MAVRQVAEAQARPRKLRGWFLWTVAALMFVSAGELWAEGAKQSADPQRYSNLSFVVVREADGTPVKNASIVIHFLRRDGRQDSEGFQLKTDSDGRTSIGDIPYGKLRVQAIAKGLRTYGEDVDINLPEQQLLIRLERPADQYSIYK